MARRTKYYIAVIADMVKSRELSPTRRAIVQKHFGELVADLNRRFQTGIAANFAVTLGDEFQGLLSTSTIIPDVIWRLEEGFSDRQLRVGIGFGALDTPIQRDALNIDGPALHTAREAIEVAAKGGILGGVFRGFDSLDEVLTGMARLLWFHRSRWTDAQRKIANLLREGKSQSEVADLFGVSRQVISKQVAALGWPTYSGGENSWRIILRDYVDPRIGIRHDSCKDH